MCGGPVAPAQAAHRRGGRLTVLFERDPAKVPQYDAMHPASAQLGCRRADRSLCAAGSLCWAELAAPVAAGARSLQHRKALVRPVLCLGDIWSLLRAQAGGLSVILPSLHALGEGCAQSKGACAILPQ